MVYSVFSESLLRLLWVKDRTVTSKTNKKMTQPSSNWGCIIVAVCSNPERSPWTFCTIPTTWWASWSILGGFIEKTLTHWEREFIGFPGSSVVKNLPANAGEMGSIHGWGRSSGEGQGNPLQCSCLGNPMDRGTWWATAYEVTKSQTWLST